MYIDPSPSSSRMALLPICNQYYNNVAGFETFSKISTGSFSKGQNMADKTWGKILKLDPPNVDNYGYYEIIELDQSGNMTQYVIYVAETGGDNSAEMTFSDITYDYEVTFNLGVEGNVPSIKVEEKNQKIQNLSNQFALIPFISVQDMFGSKYDREVLVENAANKNKDWFFKINISNNAGEKYTYLINNNNLDLARYIRDIFARYSDQNYTLALTDRYSNTLNLNIEVLSQEYNLNITNFKAKLKGGYWYIEPKDLNSPIADGVFYYVDTIELKDLEDGTSYKFDLDADGIIEKIFDDKGEEKELIFIGDHPVRKGDAEIRLQTDHEYEVNLIDCARKTYAPERIYAYDSSDLTNASITAYGEFACINEVYYSANPISVRYNNNIYSNIVMEVYKDGEFVGIYDNGFTVDDGNIVVDLSEDDENTKYSILMFNPYKAINGLNDCGALIEFKLSLMYNNNADRIFNIVLDNRIPKFSLVNTSGEDKSNIIRSDYYNYNAIQSVELSSERLFENVPRLTLSETVVLGWNNFDPSIYANNITKYYHAYLYLVEFETRFDYIVTNIGSKIDAIMNISPKEGSLGRYVLVMALYNKEQSVNEGQNVAFANDGLVSYKAFSFNISSTANAMYEVQNSDGEVLKYDALIKGQELLNILPETNKGALLTKFALSTEEGAKGYVDYQKFVNQNVPLYMSVEGLSLVPNGDNGISTSWYEYNVSDEYTIYIYKIYSKVHSTYAAILKVAKTDELVNVNAGTPAIRFVANGSENLTTNLVKETQYTSNVYGSLFFSNFYRGTLQDTKVAELNLARKNKLYLEVWYKYNDDVDGKVKVGEFDGENVIKNGLVTDENFIKFTTSGTYIIYLKDLAGNTRSWTNENGVVVKYLTITIMPEVIVSVNDEVPVDYNYYNSDVTVNVLFSNAGYYDNGSIRIYAYHNGSNTEYIAANGGRNNINSYTFTEYGTYRVKFEAKVNGNVIEKTLVFSIINANEARLALDFTQISKHNITKIVNITTAQAVDVTKIFEELINEGYIYNKLITFDRLSKENAFGSTMGKQTFQVFYVVNNDPLVPSRLQSFTFTVNNQTPSLHSSINPGESTTKDITIKFNAQTIYRQVGECYLMLNDTVVLAITAEDAYDGTSTITINEVGDYYVKLVTDSGRVITSFKVTVKEPLNTWSIVLIVAVVLVVAGIIVTFIILRTRMRVR